MNKWHLFNAIRVVRVNEFFYIQKRWLFKWKFMPSLHHWFNHYNIRWLPEYRVHFKTYEEALKAAQHMKAHFHPNSEVEDYGVL